MNSPKVADTFGKIFAAPLQPALILNPFFEQYNLRLISTPLAEEL
jgi:hypothetical protein